LKSNFSFVSVYLQYYAFYLKVPLLFDLPSYIHYSYARVRPVFHPSHPLCFDHFYRLLCIVNAVSNDLLKRALSIVACFKHASDFLIYDIMILR
jgi:hypothetical protein